MSFGECPDVSNDNCASIFKVFTMTLRIVGKYSSKESHIFADPNHQQRRCENLKFRIMR